MGMDPRVGHWVAYSVLLQPLPRPVLLLFLLWNCMFEKGEVATGNVGDCCGNRDRGLLASPGRCLRLGPCGCGVSRIPYEEQCASLSRRLLHSNLFACSQ